MSELQANDCVNLVGDLQARVIKELGRGGQGIVYLVEVEGEKKALKWYTKMPEDENSFYKNLDANAHANAPSDAFLWPQYITKKERGSFGYVMGLRPQGYEDFGNYLLAKTKFASFNAMLTAARNICDGFAKLHLNGYSYQDLNDGNFFIHPATGDVLICDNDNVMAQGQNSGIMGKARYMAPEVVKGKAKPGKYTDRFSLAVILFLLFYGNHPLEGSRVLACPCMTENFEKKFYGAEALFIYDSDDPSNRPVRGVHSNVLRRWPAFPKLLRDAFIKEFSQEIMNAPQRRKPELEWKKIFAQLKDILVKCPSCGDYSFVEDADNARCMCCGKPIAIAGKLQIGNRQVLLTVGTEVSVEAGKKPVGKVVKVNDPHYPVQLQNISTQSWAVETPSGRIRKVLPQEMMPVKAGLKIAFPGNIKGVMV